MGNNEPKTDTNNFLNWVEIKNFKSIKDLRLDCKRVNVFIGKPNVGKSNILEGLGLLGLNYSNSDLFGKDFFRYKSISNLFFDDEITSDIVVSSDKINAVLKYNSTFKTYYAIVGTGFWFEKVEKTLQEKEVVLNRNILKNEEAYSYIMMSVFAGSQMVKNNNEYENVKVFRFAILNNGKQFPGLFNNNTYGPVKRYEYKKIIKYDEVGENYLLPPYGRNLFNVIDHDEEIRKDLAEVFRPNGLTLVLSKKDRKFSVQKQIDGYVYDYPYSNIADTFQRYAFYLAAIESNTNSVIVLEEPEVHSFPPYTQELTYRMIYSEENQFFVTTHSPYLLQTLIENLTDDQLNVFITYYENYETKVRALTSEELREVMDFGIDIFYNLEKYQPNA
ncbi:AAA family ATPase [Spirosoma sp. HMF3257]|uniref:ATPase n=1 Tax=Spirosoma telluris TaxID=2183553 RepID=A0A327NTS2_9BACT|nr:AAA family ATPase [Spirosoma telluris]RAI78115.1 ATPase [Spirosoma telluris]